MSGLFVSMEGPEGSGKSTQAAKLLAALQRRGRTVVGVREPGGTVVGERIRELLRSETAGHPLCPEAEALLFAASRAQLVREVIRPALARGEWVVSDRFADSTTVYQGYGRGLDVDMLLALNATAAGETVPDVTILLDIDVAESRRRLQRRTDEGGESLDRIEREALSFHERVRHGYLDLAQRFPERFRHVDASGPEDVVADAVWDLVDAVVEGREQV